MSCKFCDINGTCQLYDPKIENSGWNSEGLCICEDNEDPEYLCEEYEER